MIPLLTAKLNQCRYIQDANKSYMPVCCGERTVKRSVWCDRHYACVYVPRREAA